MKHDEVNQMHTWKVLFKRISLSVWLMAPRDGTAELFDKRVFPMSGSKAACH